MRIKKRIVLSTLLLLGLLTGCVTKPSPQVSYYVLSAMHDIGNKTMKQAPVVELSSLQLPHYLDRPQLVTRPTPQRLKIHDQHRWGDNLGRNLERVMADNLTSLLGVQVFLVPHLLPAVDYRVVIEVHQFERIHDDQVRLRAQWSLITPGNDKPLTVQSVQLTEPVGSNADMESVVQVMSLQFSKLATEIASVIQRFVHAEETSSSIEQLISPSSPTRHPKTRAA